MTDKEYLFYYMRSGGYTTDTLAKKIGMSRGAFSKKANNIREFKAGEITRLVKVLHIKSCDVERIFLCSEK